MIFFGADGIAGKREDVSIATVVSVDLGPPPRNFDFFYPFLLIFAALERSCSPSEELCHLFFIETP